MQCVPLLDLSEQVIPAALVLVASLYSSMDDIRDTVHRLSLGNLIYR